MNGLQLNTLTTNQSLLLSVIDKITDPKIRNQILNLCIQQLALDNLKPSTTPKLPVNNYYNFQDVLRRLENSKPITIQELHQEINLLKSKVRSIKLSLQKYEMKQQSIRIDASTSQQVDQTDDSQLHLLHKMTSPKWYIHDTLVIQEEYTIQVIALTDSGADLNCIQEGLVPTKYFVKTTQSLTSASESTVHNKAALAHFIHHSGKSPPNKLNTLSENVKQHRLAYHTSQSNTKLDLTDLTRGNSKASPEQTASGKDISNPLTPVNLNARSKHLYSTNPPPESLLNRYPVSRRYRDNPTSRANALATYKCFSLGTSPDPFPHPEQIWWNGLDYES
ncbi:hypothetical protein GIB67_002697 [Kingdonia uniflora]|uniref:Peptidase A2 domain-containing protein n=1 Tax=Kingdonia uniflora TaxID=39325 RepID=A0A7J7LJM6_9MAGN|nr:hypothetical protein GIB67_002697 [Kingdonia uniflora]